MLHTPSTDVAPSSGAHIAGSLCPSTTVSNHHVEAGPDQYTYKEKNVEQTQPAGPMSLVDHTDQDVSW